VKFEVLPSRLKGGTAMGKEGRARGGKERQTQCAAVCCVEILLQLREVELRYEMCRAIVYVRDWSLCLCLCRYDGEYNRPAVRKVVSALQWNRYSDWSLGWTVRASNPERGKESGLALGPTTSYSKGARFLSPK